MPIQSINDDGSVTIYNTKTGLVAKVAPEELYKYNPQLVTEYQIRNRAQKPQQTPQQDPSQVLATQTQQKQQPQPQQSLAEKVGDFILTPTGMLLSLSVIFVWWHWHKHQEQLNRTASIACKIMLVVALLRWYPVELYWLITSILKFNLVSFILAFMVGGAISWFVGVLIQVVIGEY